MIEMHAVDRADVMFQRKHRSLDAVFAPRRVAVIGATERAGSVGCTILSNLLSNSFGGTVYPVNPKYRSVLGIKAYPGVLDLPEPIDLAVVATPAPTVLSIVRRCAKAGVKAAIIVAAGFKETGPAGAELERQLLEQVRRSQLRLIGPNSLGVMNPHHGLNATFAGTLALPGSIGFISQSGALGTAILDWSRREQIGFSAFVSLGAMLDVGWGDLIDHLGDDPHTRSILIYMESIGDARAFLSAAREVALSKPIIVLSAGCTAAGAQAASRHTGAQVSDDAALDAAFRRCGVLRVTTIDDLFNMAEVLARQPRPAGPHLTILTNAGGPGVLATDALIASGGSLAPLAAETFAALNTILPAHWSHSNPIDILGDADPERYAQAIEVVARNPTSDGLLVILTPQAMTDPTRTAEQLVAVAGTLGKPLLASWMGGDDVAIGDATLSRATIPTFGAPDTAARAFVAMWRYSDNLRGLYETPLLPPHIDDGAQERAQVGQLIQNVRAAGRTRLNALEIQQLLAAYGIPIAEIRVARHVEQVVVQAEPVGMAVQPLDNTQQAAAGDGGYELIVSSRIDPQFGPVLSFGAGGPLAQVFQDRALALPPLTTTLARRMVERTRIFAALAPTDGYAPIELQMLDQLLVGVSQLVAAQRFLKELVLRLLLVAPAGLLVRDAQVVVYDAAVREEELPPLAIRPYPRQYVTPWTLKDGTPVTIRPTRPEDEPLMVTFHETLSEQSVALRYFGPQKLSQRIAHEQLLRLCFVDYDREMVLVVEQREPIRGQRAILGVGCLIKLHRSNDAEVALLVSDAWQGQGIGSELLRRLIQVGRDEDLARIVGDVLPDNQVMLRILQRFGFQLHRSMVEPVRVVLDL